MIRPSHQAIRFLAETLLAPGFDPVSVQSACLATLGPHPRFARRLARRLLAAFPAEPRPLQRHVEAFLHRDRALKRFLERFPPAIPTPLREAARMTDRAALWLVPPLTTEGALAGWLSLDPGRLLWLADIRNLERRAPNGPLRHYLRYWVARKSGRARLIESPKAQLKTIQRRILGEILVRIPAHEAAHGFCPGRSTATFAAPHTGQEMVLRLDLRDFFPSITRSRIAAIFRTAGYPERVALLLAGLCCTVTPPETWAARPGGPSEWELRKLLEIPHLPQGAPTSPALANLCAFRLDCRLAGLAKTAGAAYTRYADDLTFSGGRDFARSARRFEITAAAIALEEGFAVNHRKTRVMPRSVSQRTAGLVVNDHVAVPREAFDSLRALLFNCLRYGPKTQNQDALPDFRAHLAGRVAQMAASSPRRKERLEKLWEQIPWDD